MYPHAFHVANTPLRLENDGELCYRLRVQNLDKAFKRVKKGKHGADAGIGLTYTKGGELVGFAFINGGVLVEFTAMILLTNSPP